MAARLNTEQRVAIVKMYYESKSTTQVQRDFRKLFASQPPEIRRRNDEEDVYFQQDGAPPHYAQAVRDWLDAD